jgi:hypothetical protein
MTGSRNRLERLQLSLTPRQAVFAWMEEAHRTGSLETVLRSLKDTPPHELPLVRLRSQVSMAVLRAMKGEPWELVQEATQQAVRDALFLYGLHQSLNVRVFEDLERLWRAEATLVKDLHELFRVRAFSDEVLRTCRYISSETPYAIDTATAAAWEAAGLSRGAPTVPAA